MTDYIFNSLLGYFIDDFIKQKQSIGLSLPSSARILHHFDLLVAEIAFLGESNNHKGNVYNMDLFKTGRTSKRPIKECYTSKAAQ